MNIKLTIGDTVNRKEIIVDSKKSPKQIMKENGRDLTIGVLNLEGSPLDSTKIGQPLEDLLAPGTEEAMLLQVVKATNGNCFDNAPSLSDIDEDNSLFDDDDDE
jgi:hypothetical protein